MFLQARETRAVYPQGGWAECVIQMRKHSAHLKVPSIVSPASPLSVSDNRNFTKHDRTRIYPTIPHLPDYYCCSLRRGGHLVKNLSGKKKKKKNVGEKI